MSAPDTDPGRPTAEPAPLGADHPAERRVVHRRSHEVPDPDLWSSVPTLRTRWNAKATGDAATDFPTHCASNHLTGRRRLTVLSLGDGTSAQEQRWAELGLFERIDSLLPSRQRFRSEERRPAALDHLVHHHRVIGGLPAVEGRERYDVVIATHSLHRLAPAPEVLQRVHELLVPDGLLLAEEYVGPSRFQWTTDQLVAAQDVLDRMPEELRVTATGRVKRRVRRPNRVAMRLTDPRAAADSDRIAPSLRGRFEVVEERPCGGAVVPLAMAGISHNFLDGDPTGAEALAIALAREDRLMALGLVGSDHAAFVCRKPGGTT